MTIAVFCANVFTKSELDDSGNALDMIRKIYRHRGAVVWLGGSIIPR